ncbi:MAG: ATP-binding protein [Pseudanabaena sp. ELA645]|jgi:signal transduction histidine kinase
MHRLLQRQLKKYLSQNVNDFTGDLSSNLNVIPLEWQNFLQAVDDAYNHYDADYRMIERSLELSSEELLQVNNQLREMLTNVEGKVAERTAELIKTNGELEQALTDLQQMQIHLIQAEKMSSLGQLIAGIAHEINNPVNFIHGNLSHLHNYVINLLSFIELSQKSLEKITPELESKAEEIDIEFIKIDLPKIIKSMEVGTHRIREIVLSLRNFSHIDEAELKPIDIHQGIEDTLLILGHRIKPQKNANSPRIQIVKQYGDLPLVNCYAGQLNQVFLNILVNAIDAIDEATSGQTSNIFDRQPCISIQTQVIDDNYVEIAIADNGSGIPEAIQQQIFNPFFTTKPVGKGTGMGMAISYQIITEKHKGRLTCVSSLGKGTEFIIHIPINTEY